MHGRSPVAVFSLAVALACAAALPAAAPARAPAPAPATDSMAMPADTGIKMDSTAADTSH
jgi:hypothetical protein